MGHPAAALFVYIVGGIPVAASQNVSHRGAALQMREPESRA